MYNGTWWADHYASHPSGNVVLRDLSASAQDDVLLDACAALLGAAATSNAQPLTSVQLPDAVLMSCTEACGRPQTPKDIFNKCTSSRSYATAVLALTISPAALTALSIQAHVADIALEFVATPTHHSAEMLLKVVEFAAIALLGITSLDKLAAVPETHLQLLLPALFPLDRLIDVLLDAQLTDASSVALLTKLFASRGANRKKQECVAALLESGTSSEELQRKFRRCYALDQLLASSSDENGSSSSRDKYRLATVEPDKVTRLQGSFCSDAHLPLDSVDHLFRLAPHAVTVQCLIAIEAAFAAELGSGSNSFLQWVNQMMVPLGEACTTLRGDWDVIVDALTRALLRLRCKAPFPVQGDEAASLLRWFATEATPSTTVELLRKNASAPISAVTFKPVEFREGFVALLCAWHLSTNEDIVDTARQRDPLAAFLSSMDGPAILATMNDRRCSLSSLPFAAANAAVAPVLRALGTDERIIDDSKRAAVVASPLHSCLPVTFAAATFSLHAWYLPRDSAAMSFEHVKTIPKRAAKALLQLLQVHDMGQSTKTPALRALSAIGEFLSRWTQRQPEALVAGRRQADAARNLFLGICEALRLVVIELQQGRFEAVDFGADVTAQIRSFCTLLSDRLAKLPNLAVNVRFAPLRVMWQIDQVADPAPVLHSTVEASQCHPWLRQLWLSLVPAPAPSMVAVFDEGRRNTVMSKLQYTGIDAVLLAVKQLSASEAVAAEQEKATQAHAATIANLVALVKKTITKRQVPELLRHLALQSTLPSRTTTHVVAVVEALLRDSETRALLGGSVNFMNSYFDLIGLFIADGTPREVQSCAAAVASFLQTVAVPAMKDALKRSVDTAKTPGARPNPTYDTFLGLQAGELMKLVIRWNDTVLRSIVARVNEATSYRQSLLAALVATREVHPFVLAVKRTQTVMHDAVVAIVSKQTLPSTPMQLSSLSALVQGYKDRASKVLHLSTLWDLSGLETIAAGLSSAPVLLTATRQSDLAASPASKRPRSRDIPRGRRDQPPAEPAAPSSSFAQPAPQEPRRSQRPAERRPAPAAASPPSEAAAKPATPAPAQVGQTPSEASPGGGRRRRGGRRK